MRRLVPALCLAVLVTSATPALTQDLGPLVNTWRDAKTDADRAAAEKAIVAAAPSPTALSAALAAGRTYAAAEAGWQVLQVACSDGKQRSFHVQVPKGYDPKNPTPLLFDLHGGVSRAALIPDDQFGGRRQMWGGDMDAAGWFLVCPKGQRGAEWWSPVGSDALLRILRQVKARFNIDDNRVCMGGFSDGASGAFYMAVHHHTPFAAFIPLNGHIAVAQLGSGRQIYLPNLRNKPLYAVNGGRDRLYPAASVAPFVERMKAAGAKLTYRVHADAGHDFSYAGVEKPRIIKFLGGVRRKPHPARVTLETDQPTARAHWVVIGELGKVTGESELPDFNVVPAPRLMLGIRLDQNHTGKGIKVGQVTDGTPAKAMDLRSGDVIVTADDTDIDGLQALRGVLGGKKFGDKITVVVQRGADKLTLKGVFTKPEPRPYFTRTRPSGRVEASAEGNKITLKTRGVKTLRLLLSAARFALDKPFELVVNGTVLTVAATPLSVSDILGLARGDADRTMLYQARIDVKLGALPKPKPVETKPGKTYYE